MKIFGFILTGFAVLQAYLWLFGGITLPNQDLALVYSLIIGVEFVSGLIAAGIVTK